LNRIAEDLSKLPPIQVYEPDYVAPEVVRDDYSITITRLDGDVYQVEGDWIVRAMGSVNFDDYESRMYFERLLRQHGVYDALEARGVKENDTIIIYDLEFEYVR